ncbi:MAG: redoxin domain-containing protein [Candidatus Kapaibacterium sp.]
MKKLYLLFFSLIIITACNDSDEQPVGSDSSEAAKEFFIKANKSSLKVNDATFRTKFSFNSPKEKFSTTLDVSMLRDASAKLGFMVRFKTDEGEGVYNGKNYYYRSDSEKKVFKSGDDMEHEMPLTQNWIINALTMVMLDQDYTDDIKARTDELMVIGPSKFEMYETDVVQTTLPSEKEVTSKVRTYFDQATNLPVKELKTMSREDEVIMQSYEILDLKINQGLSSDLFTMTIPEGYSEEVIAVQSQSETGEGQQAPDFTLKDLNGNEITLSKLRGNVVVLDFWGTWCHWCVKAMPKLQNVHEHFKGKKVIVLGVSCNERQGADPKKFMDEHKVTYNSVLLGETAARDYGVQGYPTLYVIGKDGKILSVKSGFSETMDQDLIELINKNI